MWLKSLTDEIELWIDFGQVDEKRIRKHDLHKSVPTLREVTERVKTDVNKLLKKNEQLNQLNSAKVNSHVQRESGEWVQNTLMLDGYDVPFKYKRKKAYRSLQGARVNLTYYPQSEVVAGMEFESMKIVRIRRS